MNKFIMASKVITELQQFIEKVGDVPVMIASESSEEPMTPLAGLYVVEISKEDVPNYKEQCIMLTDFRFADAKQSFEFND